MQLFTKLKPKTFLFPGVYHISKAFPPTSHLHTIFTHTNYLGLEHLHEINSICIATIVTISVKSESTGTLKKYKTRKWSKNKKRKIQKSDHTINYLLLKLQNREESKNLIFTCDLMKYLQDCGHQK